MGKTTARTLAARGVGKKSTAPLDLAEVDSLLKFRQYFNIPATWDGILITDGSGTTWQKSAGWAGVLIDKRQSQPLGFSGGWSLGTNIVAELLAVFQPAMYLAENNFGQKEHGYNLYVVTDSQYVANGLNKLTNGGEDGGPIWASTRRANRPLWLGLLGCRRNGINLFGLHVARNTLKSGTFCHNLANRARVVVSKRLSRVTPVIDW